MVRNDPRSCGNDLHLTDLARECGLSLILPNERYIERQAERLNDMMD